MVSYTLTFILTFENKLLETRFEFSIRPCVKTRSGIHWSNFIIEKVLFDDLKFDYKPINYALDPEGIKHVQSCWSSEQECLLAVAYGQATQLVDRIYINGESQQSLDDLFLVEIHDKSTDAYMGHRVFDDFEKVIHFLAAQSGNGGCHDAYERSTYRSIKPEIKSNFFQIIYDALPYHYQGVIADTPQKPWVNRPSWFIITAVGESSCGKLLYRPWHHIDKKRHIDMLHRYVSIIDLDELDELDELDDFHIYESDQKPVLLEYLLNE
ncbi:MAG: hypothetical protein HRU20_21635 [Pseudomonadales bacterium]|nr:hypothetical protein [Pseudomonadales bacterium]